MIIVINMSNLFVGGGVQVALSFLQELLEMNLNHHFHVLLSKSVKSQLDDYCFPVNFHFYDIEKSPAEIRSRKRIVSILNKIVIDAEADIVFSVFGPSYWRPTVKHLLGVADGWLYNPKSVAYKKLFIKTRMKIKLLILYKKFFLKRDADYYVIETSEAQSKLVKTLGVNKEKVFVVGNTYSSIYNSSEFLDKNNKYYISLPEKLEREFRFVYIAHNHPNKNLAIINKILPLLKDKHITFVLTIDDCSFSKLFPHVSNRIINLGPVKQKSCPSIYSQCDALFAPTLLETFSAVYPESMKMKLPILTSNYSFAKELCGDAALYFDPLDPIDIVCKIKQLVENKKVQNELIRRGEKKLLEFESARTRAEKYIALCERIVTK